MASTPAWLAAIEAMLNRGIAGSDEAAGLARRMTGTSVRFEIEGLRPIRAAVIRERVGLSTLDRHLEPAQNVEGETVVHGTVAAYLKAARGASLRSAGGTITVRGDAEIAGLYERLFRLAQPDYEEELARMVGDFPALRLSSIARRAFGWARDARRTARANISEYLVEESGILVNETELTEFLHGVDELREIADRVQARLTGLERRAKSGAR